MYLRRSKHAVPSWSRFVADMVESEVMEHHEAPILVGQLAVDVPGDVVVHFREVLNKLVG